MRRTASSVWQPPSIGVASMPVDDSNHHLRLPRRSRLSRRRLRQLLTVMAGGVGVDIVVKSATGNKPCRPVARASATKARSPSRAPKMNMLEASLTARRRRRFELFHAALVANPAELCIPDGGRAAVLGDSGGEWGFSLFAVRSTSAAMRNLPGRQ